MRASTRIATMAVKRGFKSAQGTNAGCSTGRPAPAASGGDGSSGGGWDDGGGGGSAGRVLARSAFGTTATAKAANQGAGRGTGLKDQGGQHRDQGKGGRGHSSASGKRQPAAKGKAGGKGRAGAGRRKSKGKSGKKQATWDSEEEYEFEVGMGSCFLEVWVGCGSMGRHVVAGQRMHGCIQRGALCSYSATAEGDHQGVGRFESHRAVALRTTPGLTTVPTSSPFPAPPLALQTGHLQRSCQGKHAGMWAWGMYAVGCGHGRAGTRCMGWGTPLVMPGVQVTGQADARGHLLLYNISSYCLNMSRCFGCMS